VPYRETARAPEGALERTASFRLSRSTVVALLAVTAVGGVFSLALLGPPLAPTPSRAARSVVPPPRIHAPPMPTGAHGALGALGGIGATYAPARLDDSGELELADGRYAARIRSDELFGTSPGERCEVELASSAGGCTLEIRCGALLLYSAGSGSALSCERSPSGATRTMIDHALSRDDGSPLLSQHWSDGYGIELNDVRDGRFGRTYLVLDRPGLVPSMGVGPTTVAPRPTI
jgi:hypothetical protein